MAEFSEVMRQWRRFCKSHNNCGECEFDGKGICGEAHLTDIPYADIELRIMAWATEHPEPIYPTWKEWLEEQRVVVHFDSVSEKGTKVKWELTNKSNCHIPADIAQKLGIEPKEG